MREKCVKTLTLKRVFMYCNERIGNRYNAIIIIKLCTSSQQKTTLEFPRGLTTWSAKQCVVLMLTAEDVFNLVSVWVL